MKLSEELKRCLDGEGCGKCQYGDAETKLTCRGLLRAAYEQIKKNEDLEEQGRLLKPPCAVGDTVYTNISMQRWHLRKRSRPYKAKVVFIGINGGDGFMNVDFGNGRMLQFKFSDIGKTVFFTMEAAEAALEKMQEGEI